VRLGSVEEPTIVALGYLRVSIVIYRGILRMPMRYLPEYLRDVYGASTGLASRFQWDTYWVLSGCLWGTVGISMEYRLGYLQGIYRVPIFHTNPIVNPGISNKYYLDNS
jgi:hypothetical protein